MTVGVSSPPSATVSLKPGGYAGVRFDADVDRPKISAPLRCGAMPEAEFAEPAGESPTTSPSISTIAPSVLRAVRRVSIRAPPCLARRNLRPAGLYRSRDEGFIGRAS